MNVNDADDNKAQPDPAPKNNDLEEFSQVEDTSVEHINDPAVDDDELRNHPAMRLVADASN
jgi:hypothetical protein